MNLSLFEDDNEMALPRQKMKDGMITVFARKEPTQDSVAKSYCSVKELSKLSDVVFYRDDGLTKPFARWMWSNKPPRRGTKKVTLNCWNWHVQWVQ